VPTPSRARATGLMLLATVVSASGCFSLGRNAPPQRHYVLGSEIGPQGASAPVQPVADPGTRVIGLRLPSLADYLDSPFIVVRRGMHQVEFSEYHRWAESLRPAINRTVAGLLAERTPGDRVVTAPWPGGTHPDLLIQLHLLRFEGSAPEDPEATAGSVMVLATWEVLRGVDGSLLARGGTEYRADDWRVGDFDGLVGLLDAGLRRVAQDLARDLALSR